MVNNISLTNNLKPLKMDVTHINDAIPINKPKNDSTFMNEINE